MKEKISLRGIFWIKRLYSHNARSVVAKLHSSGRMKIQRRKLQSAGRNKVKKGVEVKDSQETGSLASSLEEYGAIWRRKGCGGSRGSKRPGEGYDAPLRPLY